MKLKIIFAKKKSVTETTALKGHPYKYSYMLALALYLTLALHIYRESKGNLK